MSDRIVAVVAAYKPDADLVTNVASAAAQVDAVIVVDDGSGSASAEILDAAEVAGAIVLRRPANEGIAASLNAGVDHAFHALGADHALTLDQDSSLEAGYVAAQLRTLRAAQDAGLHVGIVGAASYGGAASRTVRSRDGFVHGFDPMQSGTLIPASTWARVGSLDEGLFIDGVDSDYTARVLRAGLAVLVAPEARLGHGLGRRDTTTFFGRPLRLRGREVTYSYHDPSRIYSITRNGTTLVLRHGRALPAWTVRRLVEEAKAHGMRLVLGGHRWTTVRAMLAGFADAGRGRQGRIPDALAQRLRGSSPASRG